MPAAQLAGVVAAHYYGPISPAERDALRPLVAVIERAAPGVARLVGAEQRPGFDVRLAERRVPAAVDADLRAAAQAVLAGGWSGEAAAPPRPAAGGAPEQQASGWLARLLARMRRALGGAAPAR